MTNEEIYDTEIAPTPFKIAKRCKELGFPFIASVEWELNETGRTEFFPAKESPNYPSAKQRLVHYAARCNGNIDAMLMPIIREANKYGHSSMYLKILGCENLVDTGNETAAIMVNKGEQ